MTVGLSHVANKARREAARAEYRTEQEAKEKEECVKAGMRAQRDRDEVPKDADEFRRSLARSLRDWLFMRVDMKPVEWHGWSLTDDAVYSIRMSVDAVVEAIMQADVKVDKALQQRVIDGYQARILAADPGFKRHLVQLVRPNAAIIEGEAS